MDETAKNGIHRTFQASRNHYSVRSRGQDGDPTSFSTDINDYGLGRHMSSMDIPHKSASPENDAPRPDCISDEDVGASCQPNFKDGDEYVGPPIHSKPHIFNPEREDCKIHVRGIDSLWDSKNETNERANIRKKQTGIRDESENDANIVFKCPNQRRIRELQSTLGQLLRIGTLEGSAWTEKTPKTPCCLVFPDDQSEKKYENSSLYYVSAGNELNESSCNNPLIVVEKIMSESDSFRVATSLHLKLQSESPQDDVIRYVKEDLTCYIKEIKRYGFDHIIIIGERYCGMLFLDCYGRVFDLDSMMNVLWFLGNYFEIMSKESETGRVAWDVLDDGTIFEIDKLYTLQIDNYVLRYFAHNNLPYSNVF
ncbi:11418_t:CDS:2 [Entrophospora sp. SA101]|nr:11418_t:CDS:2 [Entrophospora sp. SA101]CAJ0918765.1 6669_t:CDS:2 [Entrophospora sp. SA101]